MREAAASTYEHLATAIIEIETTEDELVKSILIGYHAAAQSHLRAAARDAQGRVGHLEAAAAEIANIANEGDKQHPGRPPAAGQGRAHPQHGRRNQGRLHVRHQQGEEGLSRPGRQDRPGGSERHGRPTWRRWAPSSTRLFQKAIAAGVNEAGPIAPRPPGRRPGSRAHGPWRWSLAMRRLESPPRRAASCLRPLRAAGRAPARPSRCPRRADPPRRPVLRRRGRARPGLKTVLYCGGPDKDHILESVGTGAAFVDYDGDGRLDVFLVNAWALDEEPSRVRLKGRNALYRNRGDGTFEDVTERAGVADESWGCGVCAGDYDNDGHVDLFVTNFGPNRLYRNRGDGTFEQVAERAGVADPGWGAGAAFFDADGDGDLDLYVANYIDATMDDVLAARRTILWREKVKVLAGPFGLRGGRDRFFRNNGDGTFRDATDEAGMTDTAESYGLGVLASDLDHDGDVDVFVANDSNPNFLYRNNGNGTFTEIGAWSGAGLNGNGVAQAGMGVDAADFDGDGLPGHLRHQLRPGLGHALPQRGRAAVQGHQRRAWASRRSPTRPSSGAAPSSTSTTTPTSTS